MLLFYIRCWIGYYNENKEENSFIHMETKKFFLVYLRINEKRTYITDKKTGMISHTCFYYITENYQYIPPIPPSIPGAAGAGAGSFLSATRLSVVSTIAATEAAF